MARSEVTGNPVPIVQWPGKNPEATFCTPISHDVLIVVLAGADVSAEVGDAEEDASLTSYLCSPQYKVKRRAERRVTYSSEGTLQKKQTIEGRPFNNDVNGYLDLVRRPETCSCHWSRYFGHYFVLGSVVNLPVRLEPVT